LGKVAASHRKDKDYGIIESKRFSRRSGEFGSRFGCLGFREVEQECSKK
jgi:hypothetical protein